METAKIASSGTPTFHQVAVLFVAARARTPRKLIDEMIAMRTSATITPLAGGGGSARPVWRQPFANEEGDLALQRYGTADGTFFPGDCHGGLLTTQLRADSTAGPSAAARRPYPQLSGGDCASAGHRTASPASVFPGTEGSGQLCESAW